MSEGNSMLPADVTARTVETPRLATRLLESRPEDGVPILSEPSSTSTYAAGGGAYREVAIPECGHTPYVERPEEYRLLLFGCLGEQEGGTTP